MSAFDSFDLYNILFLDIETAPCVAEFEELSDEMQELWGLKCRTILRRPEEEIEFDEMADTFKERAGIYAEFGKIICISVGFLTRQPDSTEPFYASSRSATTSKAVFWTISARCWRKHFNNPDKFALCGHNIREFDIPYICRRMMINQQALPKMIDIAGKKPWETKHLLDTLEMWKFGDIKNYTSLRLLAALFDIPSPKDDISGADVGRVYWEDRDLGPHFAIYCEKDVLATVQLFLRLKRLPLLKDQQISVVSVMICKGILDKSLKSPATPENFDLCGTMKQHLIAPSMLAADFTRLSEEIDLVNRSEADWFHLDVMDGRFVPNITFGMFIIEAMGKLAKKPLDVHLMIVEPEKYMEAFRKAGRRCYYGTL